MLQLYMPMYAVKQLHMPAAASFGVTIFGGFAPTIAETFIHVTGDKLAPSYYVLIAAVRSGLSLIVVAWRVRRVRVPQGVQPA